MVPARIIEKAAPIVDAVVGHGYVAALAGPVKVVLQAYQATVPTFMTSTERALTTTPLGMNLILTEGSPAHIYTSSRDIYDRER